MLIKTIPVGMYQANCYVVIDEETKDCIIVDPGEEASRIESVIESLDAKPKMILLTHGHFDHVGAVQKLAEKYKIPSIYYGRYFISNLSFLHFALVYKLQFPTQPIAFHRQWKENWSSIHWNLLLWGMQLHHECFLRQA